jgi:hypothetical protein
LGTQVIENKQVPAFGFEKPGEGNTNDWLTPPELVARLGRFDLDPCGCVGMPWRLADTTFFLPEQDGLVLPWNGRVFCNPPYGPHISQWAEKMAEHRNGILLIYSRTETEAWSDIWKQADGFLFPFGRAKFLRPDGTPSKSGTAPSALIAYGENNVESIKNAGISGALLGGACWLDGMKISKF